MRHGSSAASREVFLSAHVGNWSQAFPVALHAAGQQFLRPVEHHIVLEPRNVILSDNQGIHFRKFQTLQQRVRQEQCIRSRVTLSGICHVDGLDKMGTPSNMTSQRSEFPMTW